MQEHFFEQASHGSKVTENGVEKSTRAFSPWSHGVTSFSSVGTLWGGTSRKKVSCAFHHITNADRRRQFISVATLSCENKSTGSKATVARRKTNRPVRRQQIDRFEGKSTGFLSPQNQPRKCNFCIDLHNLAKTIFERSSGDCAATEKGVEKNTRAFLPRSHEVKSFSFVGTRWGGISEKSVSCAFRKITQAGRRQQFFAFTTHSCENKSTD